MREDHSYTNTEESNLIDLIYHVKKVWGGRKLIIKLVSVFFVIGCIVALRSPIIYESHTTFVPQISDKNDSSYKGLGSLASLAGITLAAEASSSLDNYVNPLLYSRIVESEEFSINLLKEELIDLNEDRFSIKDYMLVDKKSSNIISFIKKYTIDLLMSSKTEEEEEVNSKLLENYNFISKVDYGLVNAFKGKFSIEPNVKEGYIKVKASDKNAFISTQLVKLITKNLQSKIIFLRTEKIREEVNYSKEQYEQKEVEFGTLQNNLAEFKDSNKNISTAKFRSKLQKLESEYMLQQNILMTLANQYNTNKIKLNKDTPIFSVLDEVSVPNERSSPKRKKIVFIYMFLGVIISIGYLLFKNTLNEIVQKIKEN